MNSRFNRKGPHGQNDCGFARKISANVDDCQRAARREGELANSQDPEQTRIFLAACGIVISGYRAEISRGNGSSLYVRAAYELLYHFLQEQFAPHIRAA